MVALLDAVGVERAHVVGNSLGGAVAYCAAVSAPERTASLVLVAPGGVGLEVPSLMLRVLGLPAMGLLARLPRPARWADVVLESCFWDRSRIPAYLYGQARSMGNETFGEFVRVMRTCVGLRGVHPRLRNAWVARGKGYPGPVLTVWGKQDAVLPVWQARGIAEVLPQSELVLIDACGHLPQAEQSQAFLRAIVPFLARAERSDGGAAL